MSTLPPNEDAESTTPVAVDAGYRGSGNGSGDDRTKGRRTLDLLVNVVRLPGTVMVAAGTSILASVAGIDDVAEALDRMGPVNSDHLVGVGVGFIVGGVTTLIKKLFADKGLEKVKRAVEKNTDVVDGMRRDLTGMGRNLKSMRRDLTGMGRNLKSMRRDMKSMRRDMRAIKAGNKRIVTAVEGLASNINDLVGELRRGARPPARP